MVATIPGYKIIKEIGKGGMATVYLAIQESLDREVALKVLLPSLVSEPSFGERFIRETRIIAKLPHANIVPVYDAGCYNNNFYLVMELLDGDSLSHKIADGLKLAEALQITVDIAAALDFAHQQGFIHRDIKPDNILFKPNRSQAILSDFGIARSLTQSDVTVAQMVIGSPKYMSPEQALGETLNQQSDIFSLGVVLFKMLTGREPYQARSIGDICVKHKTQELPHLPEEFLFLDGIVFRMLAVSLEARYQSAAELRDDLNAALKVLGDKGSLPCIMPSNSSINSLSIEPEKFPAEELEYDADFETQARNADAVETVIHTSERLLSAGEPSAKKQPGSTKFLYATACATALVAVTSYFFYIKNNDHLDYQPVVAAAGAEQIIAPQAAAAIDSASLPLKLNIKPLYASIVEQNSARVIAPSESLAAGNYQLILQCPGYYSQSLQYTHPSQEASEVSLQLIKFPSASEFAAYQKMMQTNSFEQALVFLKNYPSSPFAYIAGVIAKPVPDVAAVLAIAQQGDPVAQFSLGELYDSDVPNLKNSAQALVWSQKASAQQYPMAWVQYALFILENSPSTADQENALALLTAAANEGFYIAQTLLGEIYFKGELIKQDKQMAFSLFEKSALQGDAVANKNLSEIYQHGYGVVEPDVKKSDYYDQLAKNLISN